MNSRKIKIKEKNKNLLKFEKTAGKLAGVEAEFVADFFAVKQFQLLYTALSIKRWLLFTCVTEWCTESLVTRAAAHRPAQRMQLLQKRKAGRDFFSASLVQFSSSV